ncbi:MAG: flagellin [Eubacteriales bacterium]|nr:flagellin [Eubacteriales bacterium]
MRINNNMMAMNTHRQLGIANAAGAKSMSKLSSGMRINSAADDAAGLSISEKMRGQIRGLNQASRNAQDGISMIQTAEGALQETESILQRMRELSVQGANETLASEDRTAIGTELKALSEEIDRIADNTKFNGKTLLNGDLAGAQLDSTGEVVVGTALATGAAAAVTSIDVSGAESNEDYTFTASGTAGNLILTRVSDSVSQEITLDATIGVDGTMNLNFEELGVNLTISGASAKTAANIVTDLSTAATDTISTMAGSTAAKIHIGSDSDQDLSVTFGDMTTAQLGTTPGATDLETLVTNVAAESIVSTNAQANTLIEQLDVAIGQVSTQRSQFGAVQNRLEHTIKNLDTSAENLQASESRIRDVDMAKEMMELTKNNILQQAAQAMLAQANQAPQGVLQLLR